MLVVMLISLKSVTLLTIFILITFMVWFNCIKKKKDNLDPKEYLIIGTKDAKILMAIIKLNFFIDTSRNK